MFSLLSLTQSGATAIGVILGLIILAQIGVVVYLIIAHRQSGVVGARVRISSPRAVLRRSVIHSNRKRVPRISSSTPAFICC